MTLRRLFAQHTRELALFVLLLCCYAYFFPRWADWNQNSRFDLVLSIVDDRAVTIEKYVANTGDYALYEGRYYTDKAPGMSLLGVPVYAVFRAVLPADVYARLAGTSGSNRALAGTLRADGAGLQQSSVAFFAGLAVVTFVCVAVPSALLGVLLAAFAIRVGLSRRAAMAAALLYALATGAFPYSNSFVGHQTSACLLFAAFAIIFAIRLGALRQSWLYVAGLLLGYAAITEYPTVLIGSILGMYAVMTLGPRAAVAGRLVLGAVPPLVILVVYDWLAFGTPLPVGYFHSALWTDVHQVGLVSLTYPKLDALWGITFDVYRGLFFLSPYLLFAALGYVLLWRQSERRPEFWVLLLAPLAFLLFNSSSAMWQGGFAVGPRYLVASLPFLGLAAGIGIAQAWRRPIVRPVVVLTIAWSVSALWIETIAGQSFPDYTPNPLFDYSLPRFLAGDIARNVGMLLGLSGWASLLPLVVIGALLLALVFRSRPTVGSVDEDVVTRPVGSAWRASR
jgi:hypothetical protein